MIQLTHEIAKLLRAAIVAAHTAGDLPSFDMPALDVRVSKREDQGDYGAAVMALAKPARLSPLVIAQKIATHIPPAPFIIRAEAAPPGYVNFWLDPAWLRAQTETIISEGNALFTLALGAGKRAQVEFVSANPTAPLHIGRSRGAIVGDTMARILEAAGYSVEREYYFNNAGTQMRNLGNSLRLRYLQVFDADLPTPGDDDKTFYRGDYLAEFARELAAEVGGSWRDEVAERFQKYAETRMFAMIKTTLARVGIQHDVFFNENSLYDSGAIWETLAALDVRGFVYRSPTMQNVSAELTADTPTETDDTSDDEEAATPMQGEATWFRSSTFGDAKDRVLVKSSGEPTYTLPDIAYHQNKIERGFDVLVNVLGADHYTQHQVVKHAIRALGMEAEKIHVILVQLVMLMREGKPVKSSSRAGNFETLDDLIDQTSVDAVRYLLMARSSDSHLNFDLDLAVKQTSDNPVYYIQYAYVRCAGIFREAALRGVNDDNADVSLLGEPEARFLKKVMELGDEIETAAMLFEPYRIAFYALELANAFHPIFDQVRVMHSDVPPDLAKARLHFYRAAQTAFGRVLRLLGMTTPDHM